MGKLQDMELPVMHITSRLRQKTEAVRQEPWLKR